jgi:hypothetical protein
LKSLIPDGINDKLNDIVTLCFVGNRVCDRAMSVLDVKFAMNKSAGILHEKLAHLFPKVADVVSTYQGSRNCLTVYGVTPMDNTDYSNPLEFFDKILEYMNDLESLCYESYHAAMDGDDITTASFIFKFTRMISRITNQCILLSDKATAYNGDWMKFDHDIDDMIILPDFQGGKFIIEEDD